jgi:hypothetical protein
MVAHPKLSIDQQRIIQDEYFNGETSRTLKTRQSLADYVIQDLHLALDSNRDLPPDYEILLASNTASPK